MASDDRYSNLTPYAISSFPFRGERGELSFEEGEVLELIRVIDGEWIEGRKGGVNGLIPLSYIQVIVPPYDDSPTQLHSTPAAEQTIGIAHVLHDFNGESSDELNVKSGSQLKVMSYVNEEWVRCFDPMTDSTGMIPLSFVQIFADEEGEECAASVPPSSAYFAAPSLTMPLPSFTPLSDDAWFLSGWDEKKSEKSQPPRPPAPSTQAMQLLEEKKRTAHARPPSPMRGTDATEKALYILDEMISSENAYFLDIMSFVSAVNDSKMVTSDKEVVGGMMGPLIQLSISLYESLTIQKDMGVVSELSVGRVFLEYRKSFSQVYSFYFRQLDSAYKIIERSDNEEILRDMMKSMKQSLPETSCLEITSTLMRPIQRCLKYPLLLTQLVKALPLNHTDHPKLVEAVKGMSALASKMNESRRRRELVTKYSEESKKSLGDRISTINLHSIHKKGSRFTTRIGKTFGIYDLPKDASMESMLTRVYKVERTCVHFIYYLTVHMKKVQTAMVNEKAIKDLYPGINSAALIKKTAVIAQSWTMNVNLNVRLLVERAMREIPKKLIQKREDKLLDYYNAQKKSTPDMTDKKREYDALSVQLRQKLPAIINTITRAIQQSFLVLRELHTTCEGAMADCIKEEKGIEGEMKTPISRASLEKIRNIAAMVVKENAKNGGVETETAAVLKPTSKRNESQTAQDRMHVWSRMSTNAFNNGSGVFRVNEDWPGERKMKDALFALTGDLVYVGEWVKKSDMWECWNGRRKGFIDASILSPVSMHPQPSERPQSTPLQPSTPLSLPPTKPKESGAMIDLLGLDSPSECSFPVLSAVSLTRRVPSLPSIPSVAESTSDPFDVFSSSRATVPRPFPLPPPITPSSQAPFPHNPAVPSVQASPFGNSSVVPSLSQYNAPTPSLSVTVLQPTKLSSSPIRVPPNSIQNTQLSSTNPFRDM